MADAIAMSVSNAAQGKVFKEHPLNTIYPLELASEEVDPRKVVDDITRRAGLVRT